MPKHPTRPGMPTGPPTEETDHGSGRHRACTLGRAALARTQQLTQRLDDHVESDNEQLSALSRDVDEVRGKVEAVSNRVGDLRVDVATVKTVVDGISTSLTEQREIKHVKMIADVRTGTAQEIAAIDDAADRRKARRAVLLKVVLVVVGSLLSVVIGALIEHFR